MKFSIIVPVYNVEKYLRRCVDSILNQTYKDFECILVDDGSTDNSGKICDEYVKLDSCVKVIHQSNKGVSAARNVGLDIASGEYICFCDSDDTVSRDLLMSLNNEISLSHPDVIIYGFTEVFNNYKCEHIYKKGTLLNEIQDNLLTDEWMNVAWNKCVKKSLLHEKRFPEGVVYEDRFFIPEIMLSINSCIIIDKSLYNYYKNIPESITMVKKSNRIIDLVHSDLKCIKLAEKNGSRSLNICKLVALERISYCLSLNEMDHLLSDIQREYLFESLGKIDKNLKRTNIKGKYYIKELKLEYKYNRSKAKLYRQQNKWKTAQYFLGKYIMLKVKYLIKWVEDKIR